MEPEKKSGVFGIILAVIILLGLVVYYLSNKKSMEEVPETTISQTDERQSIESNTLETDASLETEVENLDTNFDDMNSEDLDM